MKIYVSVDLEGISGVYRFSQTKCNPEIRAYRKACEYMMGDIASLVKGLREGGADKIIVMDGHGCGANIVPELMVSGAEYVSGTPRPTFAGLDESFDGLVLLGYHAMCNTEDGVLHHTQSSGNESQYWLNGREHGEIGLHSAFAGHTYGIAPIMVTGDEATCREAKDFFGENITTVATKKGLSREAAILYPFEETREAIYNGAKEAMANIKNCKPYLPELPIKAKRQYFHCSDSPKVKKIVVKEAILEKGFTSITQF